MTSRSRSPRFRRHTDRRTALKTSGIAGASLFGLSSFQAAAQEATPAATPNAPDSAGLGAWSEQLATLDPETITRLVLELDVGPVGYAPPLEVAETDFASGPDSPFAGELVSEISLGLTNPSSGEFEPGSGLLLISRDAAGAATALETIEPGQADDATTWEVPFAGLEGRWRVWSDERTEILLQAGPVLILGTDNLLADGARLHLMNSVSNVLQNINHVLFHLYGATNDALGIG